MLSKELLQLMGKKKYISEHSSNKIYKNQNMVSRLSTFAENVFKMILLKPS